MNDEYNVLAKLEANGVLVSRLTEEQQQVLSELTAREVALLLDIKARLDEVEPEVAAHGEIAGGALF